MSDTTPLFGGSDLSEILPVNLHRRWATQGVGGELGTWVCHVRLVGI